MAASAMSADLKALFDKNAQAYEITTKSITRSVARHLLTRTPPITSDSIIHDNACGPGIVTDEILKLYEVQSPPGAPAPRIEATDYAKGMIDIVNSFVVMKGWTSVRATVMDGQDLSEFHDGEFSLTIMNFGIFALPDPERGASEIHRTLKPGGTAVVTHWNNPRNLEILNVVQRAIRPDLPTFSPVSKEWLEEGKLERTLQSGGFGSDDIKVTETTVEMKFKDIEELKEHFSGPFWAQARKGWTEEDCEKWDGAVMDALTEREKRECIIEMVAFIAVAKKN
ncbi:hypothetical protein LTR66_002563 [Elasticomyces elasticus]|nr:hypothetical protein LTR66_002563 [Elasticomyces elasticus]KAK5009635.1 hypothetical protein LTR28_000072 [Elasticomyces elasticus]